MTGGPTTAAPTHPEHDRLARISGHRRGLVNWFLVTLTWVAVATNVWMLFFEPHSGAARHALRVTDLVVAIVLAASICWRWLRFRIGWIYLRKHWWEVPALAPLPWSLPQHHHWLLWLILIARVVRVVDRTDNVLGDRITAALVQHFSDPIVEAIRRPITVAVLDEVIDVIQVGTYATNLKAALDENHSELEAMVLDLVRNDPTTGKLRYVPFHDEIVQMTANTVLRIVDGALDDPRTTELISDVIRNSAGQLRRAVRSKD